MDNPPPPTAIQSNQETALSLPLEEKEQIQIPRISKKSTLYKENFIKFKSITAASGFFAIVCLILIIVLYILVYTGHVKYQQKTIDLSSVASSSASKIQILKGIKGLKGKTGDIGPRGNPGETGARAPFINYQSGEINIFSKEKFFEINFKSPYYKYNTTTNLLNCFIQCTVSSIKQFNQPSTYSITLQYEVNKNNEEMNTHLILNENQKNNFQLQNNENNINPNEKIIKNIFGTITTLPQNNNHINTNEIIKIYWWATEII